MIPLIIFGAVAVGYMLARPASVTAPINSSSVSPRTATAVTSPPIAVVPLLTPEQALEEAKAKETNLDHRDFGPGATTQWVPHALAQIKNMHTIVWFNGQYNYSSGLSPQPNMALIGQGTSMGLTVATQASSAVKSVTSAIPFLGSIVSGIMSLFTAIFAHHAKAVRQEQQIYDAANAAAENYLKIIHDAVVNGQASPSEAIQALDSLFNDYFKQIAPSYGHHPYCNANCEGSVVLRATVIYWQSYYQAMIMNGVSR